MPSMLDLDANNVMEVKISKELEAALKYFSHDKSPGLNGWTAEFYLHLYDMFEYELLMVVEQIRILGFVPGDMNLTFLTIIPKSSDPEQFLDFRPIALCNVVYKITSKIIANRIRGILSTYISK